SYYCDSTLYFETLKKNPEKYSSHQITPDTHRDALGGEDPRVKATRTVDRKKAAQFMLIAGCDADGSLGFPNWKQNLNLALNLQQTAAEKFRSEERRVGKECRDG